MRNPILKTMLLSMLSIAASAAFAGSQANLVSTNCPPLNAFTHEAKGKPWVLNEEYKNKGWYIFQTTEASESELNSLNKQLFFSLRLTAYFSDIEEYLPAPTPQEVTCVYEANEITLLVKSIYSYDPTSVAVKANADRNHYGTIGNNTTFCQKLSNEQDFDNLCEWQAVVIK